MEAISYLITIISTITVIFIINKILNKSNKRNKNNFISKDIKKKNISNTINNDSEKENLGKIYNNDNKESSKINGDNKSLINSSRIFNQSYNITQIENNSFSSYNDKKIYNYLYQLPFIKNRLIILDTEVAGISSLDHIIELCALEMINGKLTGKHYHSFFNPKKRIHFSILKKHKIPKSVFKNSYNKERQIFEGFLKFIDNSIIVAHNAVFDMEKINYELNYYNLPLIDKFQYRCSMRIFLDKYANLTNKFSKLKECCDFLEIKYEEENLHLAYYDAYLVGKILEKIYNDKYNNINISNNLNNNDKVKNEEYKLLDNELRNINVNYLVNARQTEKISLEKLAEENIDEIYKYLEKEETDKIIDKILKEEEKNNSFNDFVDKNIDGIFESLREEEKNEKTN